MCLWITFGLAYLVLYSKVITICGIQCTLICTIYPKLSTPFIAPFVSYTSRCPYSNTKPNSFSKSTMFSASSFFRRCFSNSARPAKCMFIFNKTEMSYWQINPVLAFSNRKSLSTFSENALVLTGRGISTNGKA